MTRDDWYVIKKINQINQMHFYVHPKVLDIPSQENFYFLFKQYRRF